MNILLATIDFDFDPIENKTRQWLGATLSTEPNSGFVLTCAPRYIYKVSVVGQLPMAHENSTLLYD